MLKWCPCTVKVKLPSSLSLLEVSFSLGVQQEIVIICIQQCTIFVNPNHPTEVLAAIQEIVSNCCSKSLLGDHWCTWYGIELEVLTALYNVKCSLNIVSITGKVDTSASSSGASSSSASSSTTRCNRKFHYSELEVRSCYRTSVIFVSEVSYLYHSNYFSIWVKIL